MSDEFTVPLCRKHHQQLHRYGNEKAWWSDMQISPLPVANELWLASPAQEQKIVGQPAPDRTRSSELSPEAQAQ
ncbi:hypothetical protein ACVWXM_001414 [Bradyrhizobium sp. GM7.3]